MSEANVGNIAGTCGAGAGVAGSVGTVIAAGGGTSAAAITTGLATVGGVIGGGMLAGVAVCAAVPLAVGGLCYGVSKAVEDTTLAKNVRGFCSDVGDWVESWFI